METSVKQQIYLVFLALAVFLTTARAATEAGVTEREIVIGQSLALTGPLAEISKDVADGARAYFETINAHGGIHGRRVRLVTLDDAYRADQTVKNVKQLLEEDKVFGLLNIMGTPNCAAILPVVQSQAIPFFAPFTGSEVTRAPMLPTVFNVRAGYRDEAAKLVQHLATVSIKRVGVVYQANAFGKEGLAAVEAAMQSHEMKVLAAASIQSDASDVDQAVAALAATQPQVILMVTAGGATIKFIKAFNARHRGVQFYTLSVMGTQANINALGSDGVGVVIASVVPFPWSIGHPLAKEYREAMQRIGKTDYSFVSFETYINAKVLGEALKRTGKDLTRARLMATTEGMANVSLGGFGVGFSKESRQGSRLVELNIIGSNGHFTR